MSLLSRDAILGANDYETEDVECPEWGGTVRVRPLTAYQRTRIESGMYEVHQSKKHYDRVGEMALRVVAWCAVDAEGKRLFEDVDVKVLGARNSAPVLRIRDVVFRLSGMNSDSAEEAVEDFDDAQTEPSSSD